MREKARFSGSKWKPSPAKNGLSLDEGLAKILGRQLLGDVVHIIQRVLLVLHDTAGVGIIARGEENRKVVAVSFIDSVGFVGICGGENREADGFVRV